MHSTTGVKAISWTVTLSVRVDALKKKAHTWWSCCCTGVITMCLCALYKHSHSIFSGVQHKTFRVIQHLDFYLHDMVVYKLFSILFAMHLCVLLSEKQKHPQNTVLNYCHYSFLLLLYSHADRRQMIFYFLEAKYIFSCC